MIANRAAHRPAIIDLAAARASAHNAERLLYALPSVAPMVRAKREPQSPAPPKPPIVGKNASSIRVPVARSRAVILDWLREHGPATCREVMAGTKLGWHTVRKQMPAMRELGMVTGHTERNGQNGAPFVIYEAVPKPPSTADIAAAMGRKAHAANDTDDCNLGSKHA